MTANHLSTEAERAAFEKCFGPKDSFAWRNEDGSYKVGSLQSAWEIWQAARRTPTAADGAALDLPELPEPDRYDLNGNYGNDVACYTAEQMEQFGRDAIAHYLSKQADEIAILRGQLARQESLTAAAIQVAESAQNRAGIAGRLLSAVAAPLSNAHSALLEAARETLEMHDDVTGGMDYGYISPKLRDAVALSSAQPAPTDPLDWPIPCDITVGAGTIRKGCKLRTLVTRMESLHRMATTALPTVTPKQKEANWNALMAAAQPAQGAVQAAASAKEK